MQPCTGALGKQLLLSLQRGTFVQSTSLHSCITTALCPHRLSPGIQSCSNKPFWLGPKKTHLLLCAHSLHTWCRGNQLLLPSYVGVQLPAKCSLLFFQPSGRPINTEPPAFCIFLLRIKKQSITSTYFQGSIAMVSL